MLRDRRGALAIALATLVAAGLFLAVTRSNPPGFYRDESSIAYNAATIAASGRDENGARFPLYFESFGDYKSPAHHYLLAAVFKVFSPGILLARFVSAVLGLAAVVLLGLLATRLAGSALAGAIVALSAALNPWLFEITRVVFEVALLPLAVVLFLLALERVREKPVWSLGDAALVGLGLALVTYTYPSGRLLAPFLAIGLGLFATRPRMRGLAAAWCLFLLALVPLLVFALRHPGALSARLEFTSYIPSSSFLGSVRQFVEAYFGDLNVWKWLADGDPNLRHHVPGMGSILVATMILAIAGLVLVVLRHRAEAWWRFVVLGFAASFVPAALTVDRLHTLRLAPAFVFLLVLTVPAITSLLEGAGRPRAAHAALAVLVAGTVLQGAVFQWQFRDRGSDRGFSFEASYPEVLHKALAASRDGPIYLPDRTYVHAWWYGLLAGVEHTRLVRLPAGVEPPPGALVVSGQPPCDGCRRVAADDGFYAWVTPDA